MGIRHHSRRGIRTARRRPRTPIMARVSQDQKEEEVSWGLRAVGAGIGAGARVGTVAGVRRGARD